MIKYKTNKKYTTLKLNRQEGNVACVPMMMSPTLDDDVAEFQFTMFSKETMQARANIA